MVDWEGRHTNVLTNQKDYWVPGKHAAGRFNTTASFPDTHTHALAPYRKPYTHIHSP